MPPTAVGDNSYDPPKKRILKFIIVLIIFLKNVIKMHFIFTLKFYILLFYKN